MQGSPFRFQSGYMTRIKIKVINTRDREGTLPAGTVLDMPELTARVWIAQGLAIEVPNATLGEI